MSREFVTMEGNEAAAHVAYALSEVVAIYPITPASPMGEFADAWASQSRPNIWGTVPSVVEMQSEGGAAGAIHGSLQAGALSTTFTASQGLLLMIPNMYKIAGELTPAVIHVAARSVAAQALSIFGDHSDVMAARSTGFGFLASSSVQEAMDMAMVAHAATLESRIPFIHFFDGFRTSHELSKIDVLAEEQMRDLMNNDLVRAHRSRSLTPDRPVIRGTAQNPDVFFQARESVNALYDRCPSLVQQAMDRFADETGRKYKLFDYVGHPEAERVVVLMGSGVGAVRETVDHLAAFGEKIGMIQVRLYRPFDVAAFVGALPASVTHMAVLDRTKEPGSAGEPLYQDCLTALAESDRRGPKVIGGRYGLSSKEFTPAMVKAIFDELKKPAPKNHFTIGINDDLTHTSLEFDPSFSVEPEEVFRGVFYGLGSDGTVGANKNSIKIIGEETDNFAQGYFVYDSKKAGAVTVSHLRFGPKPIESTYLIDKAHFVACHQQEFLDRYDMLSSLKEGGTFLLNSRTDPDKVWDELPLEMQEALVAKKPEFYVIDAYKVAHESGMGGRINTTMQVAFFAISGVLPRDEAITAIKESIRKSYSKKGADIIEMNFRAVDQALEHLHEVTVPDRVDTERRMPPAVPEVAPDFVKRVTAEMIAGRGNDLPVSALPMDGTYPTATAQWEKRNLAQEIPTWDTKVCIQCGKCAFVCPHGVIRIKAYDESSLEGAPETFKSCDARDKDWNGLKYTIQVAPEDCTGCALCVDVCPARNKSEARLKAINMEPQPPLKIEEEKNWEFFLNIPDMDRRRIKQTSIKQQQLQRPLFEFSGACAGCGETPYVKLLSQLFGDRALIANATGCSSIYSGNLPTTPWAQDANGRGPAWSNSLFEDNAEFGLGMRVALDKQIEYARELLTQIGHKLGSDWTDRILAADQSDEVGIHDQRQHVEKLKQKLAGIDSEPARELLALSDMLVRKSLWIVGGDGWAYDIGFGGLDHVLASSKDVNILVLDTEVYSNTGGQMSKATPRGAVAKFAAGGKPSAKKDLGLIAMSYGNVYVARVAMGAKDEHTLKAFLEAESYNGPSIILAYSHCIAHGINMTTAMQNHKAVVESGRWPLYRFDPRRESRGEPALQLDSKRPRIPVSKAMYMENRFKMLAKSNPEAARLLLAQAQRDVDESWAKHEHLASLRPTGGDQDDTSQAGTGN